MRVASYEWADGARFQPGAIDDASAVGQHLDHLRQHFKGELTPQDVVTDAKNPNSPLHSFFEWNDGAAAEHYRLTQARGLIRSVVAVYTQPAQPAQRIRAFTHIPEPATPHYRDTAHAMSTTWTRKLVLQKAWREFQAWKARYKDLSEFAALFEAADEIETKLVTKQ